MCVFVFGLFAGVFTRFLCFTEFDNSFKSCIACCLMSLWVFTVPSHGAPPCLSGRDLDNSRAD